MSKRRKKKGGKGPRVLPDVQELIAQQRWGEAIPLLQTQIAVQPTAKRRHDLAYCYRCVGKVEEAIATLEALDEKDARHYTWMAILRLEQQAYDAAHALVAQSLALKESGMAHYIQARLLLAQAEEQATDEQKAQFVETLRKAISFPDCFSGAYVLLAEHLPPEEALPVLQEGVARYPEDTGLRRSLARRYLQGREAPPWETFAPLVEWSSPDAEDLDLLRVIVEYAVGLPLDVARAVIAHLQQEGARGPGFELWVAGALLRAGQWEEAAAHFAQARLFSQATQEMLPGVAGLPTVSARTGWERQRADSHKWRVRTASLLGEAVAAWHQGDADRTLALADRAAEEFTSALLADAQEWVPYVRLDGREPAPYYFPPILHWYQALLEAQCNVTEETHGWLAYLAYQSSHPPTIPLLERAASLLDHPYLSAEWSEHLARQGRHVEAVQHHLRHARWRYEQESGAGEEPTAWAEIVEGSPLELALLDMPGEERRAIHAVALAALHEEDPPALVQAMMEPFYFSWWRPLLQHGGLDNECLAAATALARACPSADMLWEEGCLELSASAGDAGRAVRAFESYLAGYGPDADAYYNLAVAQERQGDRVAAQETLRRGLAHFPEDGDLYTLAEEVGAVVTPLIQVHIQEGVTLRTGSKPDGFSGNAVPSGIR